MATRNLYSVGKICIASALLYRRDSVSAFWVKLGANDLNCWCAVTPYSLTPSAKPLGNAEVEFITSQMIFLDTQPTVSQTGSDTVPNYTKITGLSSSEHTAGSQFVQEVMQNLNMKYLFILTNATWTTSIVNLSLSLSHTHQWHTTSMHGQESKLLL